MKQADKPKPLLETKPMSKAALEILAKLFEPAGNGMIKLRKLPNERQT